MSNQINKNFSFNNYLLIIVAISIFSTYFFLIGRYNLSIFLIIVCVVFSNWYFNLSIETLIPHFSGVKKFAEKNSFLIINVVSIVLLIGFSPILSFIWLFFPSVYFLYKHNYKDLILIWSILLFLWYTIFIFIFHSFGSFIIIGGSHTNDLIDFLLLNQETIWFSGLGYQTVYIFDLISQKMGCLIYIPTIFFSVKKTSCMERNNPADKTETTTQKEDLNKPKSKKGWFDSFGTDQTTQDIAIRDYKQCIDMVPGMTRNSWNVFTKSATELSKDGKRVVVASSTYIPFVDTYVKCNGRNLTSVEKELQKLANQK